LPLFSIFTLEMIGSLPVDVADGSGPDSTATLPSIITPGKPSMVSTPGRNSSPPAAAAAGAGAAALATAVGGARYSSLPWITAALVGAEPKVPRT